VPEQRAPGGEHPGQRAERDDHQGNAGHQDRLVVAAHDVDQRLGDRARGPLDDHLGHHLHRRGPLVQHPGEHLAHRDPGERGHGPGEREPAARHVCHTSMFAHGSTSDGSADLTDRLRRDGA